MKKFLIYLYLIWALPLSAQNLNDYLKMAGEQNPSLNAKYKHYLAALEKVEQQGTLPDPTLSFGYFISPVETRVGAQSMRFSLAQMFPWKGTRAVRRQLASSQAKMKFEEFQEEKIKLFLAVQSKWLQLFELNEEIYIQQENLKILKSYEPITKTKYEANLVSLTDLVRVQIQIGEAETTLALFELNKEVALGEFNELLNRPLDAAVLLDLRALETPNDLGLMDTLKQNQPQLKAAKERLQSIDYQVRLAELSRRPNIGVGLDYALVSKRKDVTITDNGKDILMPMVTLSLPVFGKKNRAVLQEVNLMRESALLEIESVENQIDNHWRKWELSTSYVTKQLAQLESEIEKTELLLGILSSEYSNANTSFEELLLTQQKLLQLQLAEVKAKVGLQQLDFEQQYLSGFYTKTLSP